MNELLLKQIFRTEDEGEVNANREIIPYIHNFFNHGLDNIVALPGKLAFEDLSLIKEAQQFTYENYKELINILNTSSKCHKIISSMNDSCLLLQNQLFNIQTKCEIFNQKASELSKDRNLNSIILSETKKIVELLEIPQLLDLCLQKNLYDEALDLISFAMKLKKNYDYIPVINILIDEVNKFSQIMLNQIFHELKLDVQLPHCLKLIGYLRRAGIFPESELKIGFLLARTSRLKEALKNISKIEIFPYITKYLEVTQMHLFEIITQYQSVFHDLKPFIDDSVDIKEKSIFHGWLLLQISEVLLFLEKHLPDCLIHIDSLLDQCMYFGLSFSRVGADFRLHLIGLFGSVVYKHVMDRLQICTEHFISEFFKSCLDRRAYISNPQLSAEDLLLPPLSAMEFPLLSEYCNSIVKVLNTLRLCVPLSFASKITKQIELSCVTIINKIIEYYNEHYENLRIKEKETINKMCLCLMYELIPYFNKCLQILFSSSDINTFIGVSQSAIKQKNKKTYTENDQRSQSDTEEELEANYKTAKIRKHSVSYSTKISVKSSLANYITNRIYEEQGDEKDIKIEANGNSSNDLQFSLKKKKSNRISLQNRVRAQARATLTAKSSVNSSDSDIQDDQVKISEKEEIPRKLTRSITGKHKGQHIVHTKESESESEEELKQTNLIRKNIIEKQTGKRIKMKSIKHRTDLDDKSFEEKIKCPVPGCDSVGHLSGLFEQHSTEMSCPIFHNKTPIECKNYAEIRKNKEALYGQLSSLLGRKSPHVNPTSEQKAYFTKVNDIRSNFKEEQKPITFLNKNRLPNLKGVVPEFDLQLYEQAAAATAEALESEVKNYNHGIQNIELGKYEMKTWYQSPYPEEFQKCPKLFICEYCLKYMNCFTRLRRHVSKCVWRHPPGDEIYRKDRHSFWEVDGKKAKGYCQNLCLLAKLFLDHKTLYYDVEPFLFYILTVADNDGCHIIGYFSKEKNSFLNYNVSCIMTLPPYQRKGFGRFLIEFSYLLTKEERKIGSPEKPLSDLGLISYRSYWKDVVLSYISNCMAKDTISIKEISQETTVNPYDLVSTLQALGIIKYWKGKHIILKKEDLFKDHLEKIRKRSSDFCQIDPCYLLWRPYLSDQ